mgnify:CR=1 FL=1
MSLLMIQIFLRLVNVADKQQRHMCAIAPTDHGHQSSRYCFDLFNAIPIPLKNHSAPKFHWFHQFRTGKNGIKLSWSETLY